MSEPSDARLFLELGGPGAVMCLGWWLSGKFRAIERSYAQSLEDHEQKDQTRHEENLARFGKISIALARMGYKNGDC